MITLLTIGGANKARSIFSGDVVSPDQNVDARARTALQQRVTVIRHSSLANFMRVVGIFAAVCVSVTSALAQSAHWEPSSGSLGLGATSELQIVFDGCAPNGDVKTPPVSNLKLEQTGTSTSMQIINGSFSRSVTVTFTARPGQKGHIVIPPFVVPTDKGNVKIDSAEFDVGEATVGKSTSLASIATSTMQPAMGTYWVGEVFPLTYQLTIARRYFQGLGGNLEWNSTPITAEEWSRPEATATGAGGDQVMALTQKSRGYSKTAGTVTLSSGTQLVNLITGSSGFGLFQQQNVDQFTVATNRPQLQFRPLPTPAPNDFMNAVGEFTLTARAVPATVAIGEPVTWTVELKGTGNWPDNLSLPQREVSKDFQVITPVAKRVLKDGTLFEATLSEDVVLVPGKAGRYTLGPIKYAFFDPKSGTYRTLTAEATTITVTAGASVGTSNPFVNALTGTASSPSTVPEMKPSPTTVPLVPTSVLPKDALTDEGDSLAPLTGTTVAALIAAPLCAFFCYWLWLAVRRRAKTDPLRSRREARAKIEVSLTALRSTPASALPWALINWQHATAAYWELIHNAPTKESMSAAVQKLSNASTASLWTQLWQDADRVIYSKSQILPTDWLKRASDALSAAPLPSISFWSALRARNLFPFIACLLLFVVSFPARADAGLDAYQKGDFATAETSWRKAVAQNPTDAHARYNLALSLGQQNRWPESVAFSTAAFCLKPASEPIRWQLALSLQRASLNHPLLTPFSRREGFYWVAALLSPACWQLGMVASVLIILTGVGLLLWRSYQPREMRWLSLVVAALLSAGCLGVGAAAMSLAHYDSMASPAAVILREPAELRSIPTDADTTQKPETLAPGTLAIVNKTFLNWSRVSFPNGQTGWVKNESLVALYR